MPALPAPFRSAASAAAGPRVPRFAGAGLAVALMVGGLGVAAAPAAAVSPDVVVNQVYGGGGNTGATYRSDFVELYNGGSVTVELTGWSVQYASASGTSWQATTLGGQVQPGEHYLVKLATGSGGTTDLPVPDATGTTAMSATQGKVALVTSTAPLTCATSCATAAGVRDLVGYGAANDAETSPAPAASNTTAVLRQSGVDTDNNAADFTAAAPNPRSTGRGGAPAGVTGKRIRDVQGAAHLSSLTGQTVLDVPGVVTAVGPRGFWFQDETPDSDAATSEGLFVFTSTRPVVNVGDRVLVDGTVTEFRPGGTTSLTITELVRPVVSVVATGVAPPPAVLIGPGGREAPAQRIEDDATDVETTGAFDPAEDAIDFYESLEGMLARLAPGAEVVGPTASFGEIVVLPARTTGVVRTVRRGVLYAYNRPNPRRVFLDDALLPAGTMPAADVGDRVTSTVTGVVDYSFSNFKLLVTAVPQIRRNGLEREVTRRQRPDELAVATFNVENLDPGDPVERFDQLARTVVENLAAPDVLAVEEVQDDNGARNDAVVTADATWTALSAAILRAGGPRYEFRDIDPVDDADGGEPGGNIRVGFLFRTDRGLRFVDRPGGDATTPVTVVRRGAQPALSISPGRIAPLDPAFENSRKPLAGEFRFRGRTVFIVANHFSSKGGDQPLFGRFQPPTRSSEAKRHEQARAVRTFVDQVLAVDRRAAVVVAGDINDFEFSETVRILTAGGALVDLPQTLPLRERYTYVFEGNSQVLDHILLSRALARGQSRLCTCPFARPFDYDIVHVNAEFADQASDHDPQVVRLRTTARR